MSTVENIFQKRGWPLQEGEIYSDTCAVIMGLEFCFPFPEKRKG